MEPAAAWSIQQLAEFVALATSFESEATAALGAVERAAEALDAEVAAIVSRGQVIASVGFAEGAVPHHELAAIASGAARTLTLPGGMSAIAIVVRLEFPPEAALVVARSSATGLSRAETSVVHGIARVGAMTMRTLHLLEQERERGVLLKRLADEQSALRRVATLVAHGADEHAIFDAVANEVCMIAGTDLAQVFRYDQDAAVRLSAAGAVKGSVRIGERYPLGGHNVLTLVQQTRLPARIDDASDVTGVPAVVWQPLGLRSAVGSPIVVDGDLWGAILVHTSGSLPIAAETERRLAGFTALVATAISNAHARMELAASRARIVSASDATRRRIERDLHDGIQQRLVTVALELRETIDLAPESPPELRDRLLQSERVLEELLEEVREISRGLHPAILSEAGLGPALKTLARRSPVPVELDVRVGGRLPAAVEVGGYYVVSEALANAAKHARASMTSVVVTAENASLRIEVCDDGVGGADPSRGSGLIGLSDRVDALGGTIAVESPPGAGTTLVVALPVGEAPPPQW